jgi:feruloyl esterase
LIFSKLQCAPGDKEGPGCFTKHQLAAIKSVYEPLVIDNQVVYPGFPYGLEQNQTVGPRGFTGSKQFASFIIFFGTNMFKFLVFNDPSWDYSKYEF